MAKLADLIECSMSRYPWAKKREQDEVGGIAAMKVESSVEIAYGNDANWKRLHAFGSLFRAPFLANGI